jgi:mycofactocin precursor
VSHNKILAAHSLSALSATTVALQPNNCIFLEESMSQVPGATQTQNVVEDVQDLLEDVSIDGMCGVY